MTFRPAAISLALLALPAFAKSEKSRVVQKALRHSVRVEVLVRGKVERAASGVVVANEGDTSYVLTNEHVVQREGLSGNASFQVVVERPKLRRLQARVIAEGKVPDEDLALLAVYGEALSPAQIVAEDHVDALVFGGIVSVFCWSLLHPHRVKVATERTRAKRGLFIPVLLAGEGGPPGLSAHSTG